MQSKGLDFLRPIWAMIYSDKDIDYFSETEGLNLSESDVSVTYTRYINNYKIATKDTQTNDQTIDDAFEAGTTPGQKILNLKNSKLV